MVPVKRDSTATVTVPRKALETRAETAILDGNSTVPLK
jgi:hypothetical protein